MSTINAVKIEVKSLTLDLRESFFYDGKRDENIKRVWSSKQFVFQLFRVDLTFGRERWLDICVCRGFKRA